MYGCVQVGKMDAKPTGQTMKEKGAIPNTIPGAHSGHEEFFQFFMKVPPLPV
jgi:hypothetical protein